MNKKNNKTCITRIMRKCKFDDIIKIDGKSYKNVLRYKIGYVTVKDLRYVTVNIVKSLYLINNKKWIH